MKKQQKEIGTLIDTIRSLIFAPTFNYAQAQLNKDLKRLRKHTPMQDFQTKEVQKRQEQLRKLYDKRRKQALATNSEKQQQIQWLSKYIGDLQKRIDNSNVNQRKKKQKKPHKPNQKLQKSIQVYTYNKKEIEKVINLLKKPDSRVLIYQLSLLRYLLQRLQNSIDDQLHLKKIQQAYTRIQAPPLDLPGFCNDRFFLQIQVGSRQLPQYNDYVPINVSKQRINLYSFLPQCKRLNQTHFNKFEVQTLIFVFYYQKNTCEQLLSSKQLRQKQYRYHVKHLNWLKRVGQPKFYEEYEQGNYLYFDYKQNWNHKKKQNYKFKYKQKQQQDKQ